MSTKVKDTMFTRAQSPSLPVSGSDRAPAVARTGIKPRVPTFEEHRALVAVAHEQRAALFGQLIGEAIGALSNRIGRTLGRRAAMAELDALDDRMLADIGIARGEIHAAAANENANRRTA